VLFDTGSSFNIVPAGVQEKLIDTITAGKVCFKDKSQPGMTKCSCSESTYPVGNFPTLLLTIAGEQLPYSPHNYMW